MHLLAYNTRFLILPWVQVAHLASHILGRMAKQVSARLATAVRPSDLLAGDVRGHVALSRDLLSRGQLAARSARQSGRGHRAPTLEQTRPVKKMLGLPLASQVPGVAQRMKRPRMDVNLEELDRDH